MADQSTQLTTESAFSLQTFEHAQRVAIMISKSDLVPERYKDKVSNVMVALEMANRMNISPLMVMQNLYIVKGNPGWSAAFIIGLINNSKRFSADLKFEKSGDGETYGYTAFTFDKEGKRIEGTKIDWKMVKAEGWFEKPGSKWKTMPEQMFKYRSATFFGREHCPDLLFGMQTVEEIMDVQHTEVNQDVKKIDKEAERVTLLIKEAKTLDELKRLEPFINDNQIDLFEDKKLNITEANGKV